MGAFDDIPHILVPDPSDSKAEAAFRKKWGWEPHEQVILKGIFTAGDQETMNNASVTTDKSGTANIQAGTARIKMLECMIVDWTLLRNGQRVPVSSSTIKRLPANYSNPLLERCDELAATMQEQEQEDFFDSANEPFSANSGETKLSLMLS
jgi:hypothetical protein